MDFNLHAVKWCQVNAAKEVKVENDLMKSQYGEYNSRIESLESSLTRLESLLDATSNKK